MAKPQKQKKQQQQSPQKNGLNTSNFFDSAVFEYVEDGLGRGLSNGKWFIDGKPIISVIFDIATAPEAWTARAERRGGVFSTAVERHFRLAFRCERHWCKDFTLSALRGLVEYVSSAIFNSTYRATPGGEKAKYRAADAASASFEKRYL